MRFEALLLSEPPTLPSGDGSLVKLSVDRAARVAVLELNDPEHFNAISAEMADDMLRAVLWLRSQPPTRVKAVVLQGPPVDSYFLFLPKFECRRRRR